MKQAVPSDFVIKQSVLKPRYKYSICSLVTDLNEYYEMVSSFNAAGFNEDICEFRYIDNSSGNNMDAYSGLNVFLQAAQGEYVILCHQDIVVEFDQLTVLDKRIAEISALDPNWGILSNAGGLEDDLYQRVVLNVAYPGGRHDRVGRFPWKVASVDEHFIIVKKAANLALSHDLSGFHLYGTDLCLIAELLGYSAYVIDFKILHKSFGKPNHSYDEVLQRLIKKYRRFMRNRRIVTTIADFYMSASELRSKLAETTLGKKISRKRTKLFKNKTHNR